MKRLLASMLLVCALSLSVMAGDTEMPGATNPPPPPPSASVTIANSLLSLLSLIL